MTPVLQSISGVSVAKAWFLEGYIGDSKLIRRLRLNEFPCRVGRQQDLTLPLDIAGVSRNHAEFIASDDGRLILRDLNSIEGTYINRQRLAGEQEVRAGDIIHFADQEFCLVVQDPAPAQPLHQTQTEKLPQGAHEFQQMLLTGAVSAAFQPIVDAQGSVVAHELLGRGAFPGLPFSPWQLFQIAERLDLEIPFSDLLRCHAVATACQIDPHGTYFFNIHPRETEQPDQLLRRMDRMRETFPTLRLVLEIHEVAVTDVPLIRRIRDHLKEIEIDLAYDHFGAGQARLIELTEVSPDYVKLDTVLIQGIDTATEAKRQMIAMFQKFLSGLGIATLAEGVETAAEAEVLRDLGIDLYQGYYFARPGALPVTGLLGAGGNT